MNICDAAHMHTGERGCETRDEGVWHCDDAFANASLRRRGHARGKEIVGVSGWAEMAGLRPADPRAWLFLVPFRHQPRIVLF